MNKSKLIYFLLEWQREASKWTSLPRLYSCCAIWMCFSIFIDCFCKRITFISFSGNIKVRIHCCILIDICIWNWGQGNDLHSWTSWSVEFELTCKDYLHPCLTCGLMNTSCTNICTSSGPFQILASISVLTNFSCFTLSFSDMDLYAYYASIASSSSFISFF